PPVPLSSLLRPSSLPSFPSTTLFRSESRFRPGTLFRREHMSRAVRRLKLFVRGSRAHTFPSTSRGIARPHDADDGRCRSISHVREDNRAAKLRSEHGGPTLWMIVPQVQEPVGLSSRALVPRARCEAWRLGYPRARD